MKKLLCLVLSLFFLPHLSHAQNPGTGAYPFASFDKPGFDSINLGNLNTRFTIPIVNRQGRGQGFNYSLQYEGLIWTNVSGVWIPDPSWGFRGMLNGSGFTGYITYTDFWETCPGPSGNHGGHDDIYSNVLYYDAFGGIHSFDYSLDTHDCPEDDGNQVVSGDGSSNDGSGYKLLDLGDIQTRSGSIIRPSYSTTGGTPVSITDRNGNKISGNGSGAYTDTLGVTALSVSGSNPVSFTYPVTEQTNGASTATANLSYQTHTVRTNFGCSGVVEYGSTNISLPYRLTLADGSYYEFSYESTYQATDGAVTGRLSSVRLPTGGTIQYSYTAGCSGAGINADGTVGSLTRVTSDGTRAYGRASLSGNSTSTTLQDEKGNQTLISFTIDTNTQNFYETHRTVHQGNTSQSVLSDAFTCYNGTAAPCDSTAITLPISEVDVTTSYSGGSQVLTKNYYDANGSLLAESDVYSGSTILHQTLTSYNSFGEPLSVNKYSGSNSPYATTTYGYDETGLTATSGIPQHTTVTGQRGNLTSVHVTASPNINTSTTYYDTGMPASSTAADGGQTTYTYDSTGAFVTGTALPATSSGVPLSTSANYDAYSASLLSSTGMNSGETTTILSYDPNMVPTSVQFPGASVVTVNHDSANQITSTQTLDSLRTANTKTILDGYGRVNRSSIWSGQSPNGWYNTDYCYDSAGLLAFQSVAYAASSYDVGSVPLHCSSSYPGTSIGYDALGRVLSKTTTDGTASWWYNDHSVKSVDVNGVGKIVQYNALGQLSSICELSTNTLVGGSPTDCGSNIAGNGFLTTYSYDLANHTTSINQGGQLRTFVTDAAGRPLSVTEPESGVTSYNYGYNANGLSVIRTRPKANQSDSSVHTNTATQYDRLGRIVSVTYDDGITSGKYFYYDVAPSLGWSSTPTNVRGRLVATTSDSGTRSQYTYNVAGTVQTLWQCAPSICGTGSQNARPLWFAYDFAGALVGEADSVSGNIVYWRSVAEQITGVTNQDYTEVYNTPNLVRDVVNGPFGPTNWHTGNGLSSVQSFDSLGRVNGGWVCSGNNGDGQSAYCANNAQLFGYTLSTSGNRVTGMCDTAVQCQSHSYDDFGRLTSVSGNANFSWSYDRWGNRISQTGSPSVTFSPNSANNHDNDFGYDAAGNETNDAVHSYTYDAEGKVVAVDGGSTAQYVYDALGQRIRATVNGSTTEYLYDLFGRRMSSWYVDGSATGIGNEGRIYWDYGLLANRSWNGETFFHHANWLGTERMRTNYQGLSVNQQTSNAFGDGFMQSSPDTWGAAQDNNQFTSQEQDAESGTIHFQYRQYSSTQGRWMSPDPYSGSYQWKNPQSLNRYAYVQNNPFSFTDPLGLAREANPCGDDDGSCVNVSGGGGGGGDDYDLCMMFPEECGFGTGGVTPPQSPPEPPTDPPTSTNTPTSPTKSTCKMGFGAGVTIGADAGAGIGPLGAGANGSVGVGIFGGNGINAGAFASGGAAARSFSNLASAAGSMIHNFFAGAGGGVGGGLFLTNASQASQLSGQSQTYNVDLGYFANGSGQFSIGTDVVGNEIWSFSFQVGVGGGGLFHAVTNKTVTAGRKGGC